MAFSVPLHYNAVFNYMVTCIHPFLVWWPEETGHVTVIFLSLTLFLL